MDVSYAYEKMFVVRPQFFIPIISLLRNAALNSLVYKKQLAEIQSQQVDLYNFENNLMEFKGSFGRSVELAGKNYTKAIDDIQKAIDNLKDVKEKLELSMRQLNQANNKLDDVSIKKLTKNAPSVKQMFDEIKNEEG